MVQVDSNRLGIAILHALIRHCFLNEDDLFQVVTEAEVLESETAVSRDEFDEALKQLEDDDLIVFGQVYADCWSRKF